MPICFPQFSGRGPLPKHGFARASAWTLDAISERHDGASSAVFSLRDSARSFAIWPESFLVQMTVTLEPARLIATLSVSNPGDKPWSFSGALHTYFRVDDIAETALIGLQSTHYQDATANNVEVREQARSVTIDAELDRVYMSPPLSLELAEHGKPSLYIEQSGFIDTVVWNPGPVLAAGFKDFPAGDWRHMLCIEAANAARPVVVQAGETWIGSQTLSVA
jgi:glucose-6-phosphate 1-epimerase